MRSGLLFANEETNASRSKSRTYCSLTIVGRSVDRPARMSRLRPTARHIGGVAAAEHHCGCNFAPARNCSPSTLICVVWRLLPGCSGSCSRVARLSSSFASAPKRRGHGDAVFARRYPVAHSSALAPTLAMGDGFKDRLQCVEKVEVRFR